MRERPRILIIDDDTELCALVSEYLEQEGFGVDAVHDGECGARKALEGRHSLVVLDVMLPGLGGFDVLRRIRSASSTPVLMLTARGEEVDRIVGLELGADDYLAKPFNPRELAARLRAILRRASGAEAGIGPAARVVAAGDIELNLGSREARRGAEVLSLTGVEFTLLEYLLRFSGRMVTREELSRAVLGRHPSAYDRSLDVHVSNLRKKLGPLAGGKERIKTIRGHGYLYVDPAVPDGAV